MNDKDIIKILKQLEYRIRNEQMNPNEKYQLQLLLFGFINIFGEENYHQLVEIVEKISTKMINIYGISIPYWNQFLSYSHSKIHSMYIQ